MKKTLVLVFLISSIFSSCGQKTDIKKTKNKIKVTNSAVDTSLEVQLKEALLASDITLLDNLLKTRVDINKIFEKSVDQYQETPLTYLIKYSTNEEFALNRFEVLAKYDLNVTVKNQLNQSPKFLSITKSYNNLFKKIFEHNGSFENEFSESNGLLRETIKSQNFEIFKWIIFRTNEFFTFIDLPDLNILIDYSIQNKTELEKFKSLLKAKKLLEKDTITDLSVYENWIQTNQFDALLLSLMYLKSKKIELSFFFNGFNLLEKIISTNKFDESYELIKFALESPMNANGEALDSKEPIFTAVNLSQYKMVQMLIDYNGDEDLLSKEYNESPLSMAIGNADYKMAVLLNARGAEIEYYYYRGSKRRKWDVCKHIKKSARFEENRTENKIEQLEKIKQYFDC